MLYRRKFNHGCWEPSTTEELRSACNSKVEYQMSIDEAHELSKKMETNQMNIFWLPGDTCHEPPNDIEHFVFAHFDPPEPFPIGLKFKKYNPSRDGGE